MGRINNRANFIENNKISRIRFEVDTKSNNFGDPQPSAPAQVNVQKDNELASAQLDKRFTFDAFVVGKPNELAHAQLDELLKV